MPRLRHYLRNQIVCLLQAGICLRECARRFHVNKSTIHRLHQRFLAKGIVADRPRPVQPGEIIRCHDIYIRQRHLRNRLYRRQYERYHDICVQERDRFGGEAV